MVVEQEPVPVVNATRKIEWENTVTILGIGLCAIIVIAAVSFVLYNKFARKKKPKYAMAAQEDTPTHVARSTSMHSSPSRESANGGVEIDQDMERPLTGGSKRKDSNSILSRGPSISSKASNSYKKIKTRADIESGGNLHSPLEYAPLQSPLVASVAGDANGPSGNGSLKSSPLSRQAHPRSPKIHPSPKMSRPSNPSTPLSPPETKHDLLTRKRREAKEKEKTKVNSEPTEQSMQDVSFSDTSSTAMSAATAVCILKTENDTAENNTTPNKKGLELAMIDTQTDKDIMRKSASGASDESFSVENEKKPVLRKQTTSFMGEKSKARRPVSLTEKYDSSSPDTPTSTQKAIVKQKESIDVLLSDGRRRDLPKPDGQSPKSPREEVISSLASTPTVRPNRLLTSPSKSNSTFASPSHSSHTPSDVGTDALGLEYDDYIDFDDPFSYFDPEETMKLRWVAENEEGNSKDIENNTPT